MNQVSLASNQTPVSEVDSQYYKFLRRTDAGTRLLAKYALDQHGYWQIRGEDSNLDMGGNHYMPVLGVVEGVLEDVIHYAVNLTNFWQYGYGGEITKIEVKSVDKKNTIAQEAVIRERKKALECELTKINKQLKL